MASRAGGPGTCQDLLRLPGLSIPPAPAPPSPPPTMCPWGRSSRLSSFWLMLWLNTPGASKPDSSA